MHTFCAPAGRVPRRVGLLLDEARFRACRAHAVLVTGRVGDVAAVVALDEALRGAREDARGTRDVSATLRHFGRRRNFAASTSALVPSTWGL